MINRSKRLKITHACQFEKNPRQNDKIGNTINTFTTQLLLISDHIQDFIKVLCKKTAL